MQALIVIFAGILGLIIGSFLNVVIFRMNTGKGLGGRSMCLSCNRTLKWYELVPVLSFLMQKGKCRNCHSKLSWQYPAVEVVAAILFAGVAFFIHEPVQMMVWFMAVSLGMIIAVYDIRHKMIPFYHLAAFGVISLFLGIHLLGAVLVALPFLILWGISKGKWIGFGDIEIMAIMGLVLGLGRGYSAVVVAFWIAVLVMVPTVAYFKWKKKSHDPEIPFGPFLLFAFYLIGITGFNIFSFIAGVVQ